MITPALQEEIEKAFGRKISRIAPLSAANNAQIYRLTTENDGNFVAKVAERGLDTEAFMLRFLKTETTLPVPDIYYSNEHLIIMQFIETNVSLDAAGEAHAAEALAALHAHHAPQYGFERDTLIGSLRQPNTQNTDWVAFFAQHRLLYMAGEALKEGKIDSKTMKRIEKLAGKLGGYIMAFHPPSLIHGDIWSGNILPGRSKIAAFLDPAIYYAEPEVELAFIRLFNTFGETFFRRYHEISPLQKGFFETRADIYNLYPLLVHTRLFGASYARKVQKILDKFV